MIRIAGTISAVMFGLVALAATADAQVDVTLAVADRTGSTDTLYWGALPEATNGRDVRFGEQEYPPPPPSFIFDARWVGPGELGEGAKRNYRDPSNRLDTFVLRVQPNEGGQPITLSWPDLKGTFTTAQLRYAGENGGMIAVDMLEKISAELSNPSLVSLVTIVTSRER